MQVAMVTFSLLGGFAGTALEAQGAPTPLQASMPLAVRVFDRTDWAISFGDWYSKRNPHSEPTEVRFHPDRSTSASEKCVRKLNFAVVDIVTGRV